MVILDAKLDQSEAEVLIILATMRKLNSIIVL